jgi:hypothetical protein
VQSGFGPGFAGRGGFRGQRWGGFPRGGFPGGTTPGGTQGGATQGGATTPGGFPTRGQRGGMGGLLDAATVSAEMKAVLEADVDSYTWVAAAVGSQNASGYQLATGLPIMPIGGFNGSDPSPTLAQFQQYVQQGKIHYFIGGGGGFGRGGQNGGSNSSSQIARWVAENFTAQTVGGVTVYDLSSSTTA